ncbi:hypothetical protein GN244_ATG17454 [Phytophthora infestans]|uniref:Secreted RxLR effector peptide protein n=1 Tax=Phytophthora infestans TaxID=4787 RepID=A0A833SA86_PHYIN|nr:hypothetical protein GN244_ATG17454 [Phytophthora infestans]KAF4142597.1 hypothetical protein GN958_ATG08198 [Phytophthora infestans]
MTLIWYTLFVMVILVAESNGLSEDDAADSRVTFMESVLMIRLINSNDNEGGDGSKRFLRQQALDNL